MARIEMKSKTIARHVNMSRWHEGTQSDIRLLSQVKDIVEAKLVNHEILHKFEPQST